MIPSGNEQSCPTLDGCNTLWLYFLHEDSDQRLLTSVRIDDHHYGLLSKERRFSVENQDLNCHEFQQKHHCKSDEYLLSSRWMSVRTRTTRVSLRYWIRLVTRFPPRSDHTVIVEVNVMKTRSFMTNEYKPR